MDQENFSDMFNKFSQMMENGEIPDNIKDVINNFSNNSGFNSENSQEKSSGSSAESQSSSNSGNSFNLDFETLLKLQNIMNSLNNQKDDPRTNLLLSLKPYLKDSRKQKLEQYINLFKMTKIIELFNKTGGENTK